MSSALTITALFAQTAEVFCMAYLRYKSAQSR